MSQYAIFTSRAEADAFSAKVDSALGYPKIGPGKCTAEIVTNGQRRPSDQHPLCCSPSHGRVRELEDGTWCYFPVDDQVRALRVAGIDTDLASKPQRERSQVRGKVPADMRLAPAPVAVEPAGEDVKR